MYFKVQWFDCKKVTFISKAHPCIYKDGPIVYMFSLREGIANRNLHHTST